IYDFCRVHFFFPADDGIRPFHVTGVQTCALPILQRWTDSSISKTANCPNNYTVEQTRELYEYAYRLGCKGVTIYRDGSRDTQVLKVKEAEEDKASSAQAGGGSEAGERMAARSEAPEVAAEPAISPASAAGGETAQSGGRKRWS